MKSGYSQTIMVILASLLVACAPPSPTPVNAGPMAGGTPKATAETTFYKIFITACSLPTAQNDLTVVLYSRFEPIVSHPRQGATYAYIAEYWQLDPLADGSRELLRRYPATTLDTLRSECTIASRQETRTLEVTGGLAKLR